MPLQLSVTASEANTDGSLALADSLEQSVTSGKLAAALSSAVGYPVDIASEGQSSLYLGRAALESGSR